MIYSDDDHEYISGVKLSDPEDPEIQIVKAIQEGDIESVENLVKKNTHLLIADINTEKLSILSNGNKIVS